jgi:hypothetical protein
LRSSAKLSTANTELDSMPQLPQSTNPIIECLHLRESTLLEQQVLYTSLRDLQRGLSVGESVDP